MPPERDAVDAAQLRSMLREHGLRATAARIAVLRGLMAVQAPLTHAQVCELVDDQGLDRATVYRNLVDLAEVGLVQRGDLGDHMWRFTFAGANQSRPHAAHPHFVCSECGDVQCLPDDAVALSGRRDTPKALRRQDVEIQIRGLCDHCEE